MRHVIIFPILLLIVLIASPAFAAETELRVKVTNDTVKPLRLTMEIDDGDGSCQTTIYENSLADIRATNSAHEDTSVHSNKLLLYRGDDIIAVIMILVTNQNAYSTGPTIERLKVYTAQNLLGCNIALTGLVESSSGSSAIMGPKAAVTVTLSNCDN